MDKSMRKKNDSTCFPTLVPETMVVGPERPRESLEEEGGGRRPGPSLMLICRWNEQKPLEPIPGTSAIGPLCPQETEEKDDSTEDS